MDRCSNRSVARPASTSSAQSVPSPRCSWGAEAGHRCAREISRRAFESRASAWKRAGVSSVSIRWDIPWEATSWPAPRSASRAGLPAGDPAEREERPRWPSRRRDEERVGSARRATGMVPLVAGHDAGEGLHLVVVLDVDAQREGDPGPERGPRDRCFDDGTLPSRDGRTGGAPNGDPARPSGYGGRPALKREELDPARAGCNWRSSGTRRLENHVVDAGATDSLVGAAGHSIACSPAGRVPSKRVLIRARSVEDRDADVAPRRGEVEPDRGVVAGRVRIACSGVDATCTRRGHDDAREGGRSPRT